MLEYLLSLSLLIVVVLLIRGIFHKTVSPRAIYALWLVVVLRMLLPITLFEVNVTLPEFMQRQQTVQEEQPEQLPEDSEISADMQEQAPVSTPMQTAPTIPSQSTSQTTPEYPTVITPITPTTPVTPTVPADTKPVTPDSQETIQDEVITPEEPIPEVPEEPVSINWKRIANLVWFSGALIASVWVLLTSFTYSRRLRKDRVFHRTVRGTKVYVSEYAGVPCIAGLIPSIYITPEAANSKSEILIIIHEHVHIRHGDHIWSIIRALALIIFWWNPLVWVAATVSKQDAELACDDAISSRMNDAGRLKYANILIDTIPQKHRYAVGLGSAPMKERILMLTKKQKNRVICLILAIVLAVSAVGCSFVSLNEKVDDVDPTANDTTASSGEQTDNGVPIKDLDFNLLMKDHSERISLYCSTENYPHSAKHFRVNFGEHEAYIIPKFGSALTRIEWSPELYCMDIAVPTLPADGIEDAVVILTTGTGTGVHTEEAYVLSGADGKIYSFIEPYTMIENLVERDKNGAAWIMDTSGNRIDLPDNVYFDQHFKFYIEDGCLYAEVPTGYGILQYTGDDFVIRYGASGSTWEYVYANPNHGKTIDTSLTDLLAMPASELRSAYGPMTLAWSEAGPGQPVYQLGGKYGVYTVYYATDMNETIPDNRCADEIIVRKPYSDGDVCGLFIGDEISESTAGIYWTDASYSIINGHILLSTNIGDYILELVLGITPEQGALLPNEAVATAEEWAAWESAFIKAPFGKISSMRIRKELNDQASDFTNTQTLSITHDSLYSEMERIEENELFPAEKYTINVTGMSVPVKLYMQFDSVAAIEAHGQYVEIKELFDIYGNCSFELFESGGAVVIEGGYYEIGDVYIISPERCSEMHPGTGSSYWLLPSDNGSLKYLHKHNGTAGIMQTGPLSCAVAYDEFLFASGDASIKNGELFFAEPTESYTMSDRYDLDKEFRDLWSDEYSSIEEIFARNLSARNVQQYGQGPFIGYVADKETPWITLYTSKTGTYVGRIPYEIFNLWPATDRDSEWWTPGWEPEYMKYYYAEFGDFCWAAVHLGDTVLGSGRKNIATSTDGGKTWNCGSYMDDYGGNHVISIGFLSRNIAYMTFHPENEPLESSKPAISRTEDGGKTWQRLDIQVPDILKCYKMFAYAPERLGDSTYRIPIVMYDENGVRRDTELRTYDMGYTWRWQIELTQDQDISFETKTVSVNDGSMVSVAVPAHWVWNDSSHIFDEKDQMNTASTVTIKRAVIMKRNIDITQLKEELSYGDSEYSFDSPIIGTTDKGYTYEGYYGNLSEAGRYIFLVNTGSDTYTFEVWTWHGYDGDSFFDDMVMPILNSFTVDQSSSLMKNYPTDEEILAEYKKATKIDDIFALAISELVGNVDTSVDKPIKIGDHHYFESKKYSSFDELRNELLTVFSKKITDEMLDLELIKNVDGKLYAVLADGGDSAPISYRNEIGIIPISDTKLTLRVTVKVTDWYLRTYGYYASGQIIDTVNVDFTYEKIGDNWVFTEFPYIRGVFDSKLREKYTEYEFDFGKLVLPSKYDGQFIFKTGEGKYLLTAAYDPHGDGQYSDDQVFKIWRIPLGEEIPKKDGLTVTNAIGYDDKYVYMMTSGVSTSRSVTYESGFDDAVCECVTAIVTYTPHVNGWQYFGVLEHLIPIEQNTIHQSILENKTAVYSPDSKSDVLLSDYLKSSDLEISKYIVLDLDENGAHETILWLEKGENEYLGFLILNNKNEKTYAHLLYYRQFADLKTDGTFSFSSGVSNHGIGRLYFSGDTCTIDKIAYCESADNQNIYYFIENKSVSKETFDAYMAIYSQKPSVSWYDYTYGT